jgi:hypothetical protein
MPDNPGPRPTAGQQTANFLLFLLKLAAFLGGLAAFGFAVFWLRRSLG